MKLFSRKALAAVATTAALTVSGMTAPAFAEEAPANSDVNQSEESGEGTGTEDGGSDNDGAEGDDTPAPAPADNSSSFGSSSNENGEGSSDDLEAKEIREWIGVFTAIIGALSTVFVFAQRIM